MLHFKPSGGQSQTVTTQTVIQMFREARMWDITPDELMTITLLNMIQEKTMMVKVQERLDDRDN